MSIMYFNPTSTSGSKGYINYKMSGGGSGGSGGSGSGCGFLLWVIIIVFVLQLLSEFN